MTSDSSLTKLFTFPVVLFLLQPVLCAGLSSKRNHTVASDSAVSSTDADSNELVHIPGHKHHHRRGSAIAKAYFASQDGSCSNNDSNGNATAAVKRSLRIAVLASRDDMDTCMERLKFLPPEATVVAMGANLADWKARGHDEATFLEANVVLIGSANGTILGEVLKACTKVEWIHGIFAGLDHLACPAFTNGSYTVTNAKGVFSSSLAEWAMLMALFWNKNLPRFLEQQRKHVWNSFGDVGELHGKTLGIVGYGDIGRATAKLGKAFGMKTIGCRRRPELSASDAYMDDIGGMDSMDDIFRRSDVLVLAAALTSKTAGMVGEQQFAVAKRGQIFINVGRGKLVDESALLAALNKATDWEAVREESSPALKSAQQQHQQQSSKGGSSSRSSSSSDGESAYVEYFHNKVTGETAWELPHDHYCHPHNTDMTIAAAALDVFSTEPLPSTSPFWGCTNVICSSHNADMTTGFRHRSVDCFVENCCLWVAQGGKSALINVVSAKEGY